MTGAVGLPDPDDPTDVPLEAEGVGQDPGAVSDNLEAARVDNNAHETDHDSKKPPAKDEPARSA